MKLPKLGRKSASTPPKQAVKAAAATLEEWNIDELARAAKTTVRNIRAYQDRGLVPAPERRGRDAVYGKQHLSRLRIIGQMLARGYTLASIGELIIAWEDGQNLGGLLGLEQAVSSPWSDETPVHYSLVDLVKLFGRFEPRWLMKASDLGILKQDGARFLAPSPRMIQAGAELVKAGIPLDQMLDVVARLRANVETAADQMVQLVEQHLFGDYGDALPPADEAPRLTDIIWRLRPLVEKAVNAEVARAMEIAANRHLGDRLERLLEQQIGKRKRTVP